MGKANVDLSAALKYIAHILRQSGEFVRQFTASSKYISYILRTTDPIQHKRLTETI